MHQACRRRHFRLVGAKVMGEAYALLAGFVFGFSGFRG